MKIKFCGIRNEQDLKAALAGEPDSVGFLVGQVYPSEDFILPCTAARLAAKLPPFVQPAIVTHLSDPDEIIGIVMDTGIINVQLHGEISAEQTAALRNLLPESAKLVLALHLKPGDSFNTYADYFNLVNGFLIDSCDPQTGRVGGTGITCDWQLASQFVKDSPLPVILAGGLTSENVADAINQVHPYGVDVNSGLKNDNHDVTIHLCTAFAAKARLTMLAQLQKNTSSL